ncbi:MAG: hypothetical protein JWP27_333 [Flaviaesturariibacter sp.]|nr:hypothetical protein [Flaviaesturariibacter sp.]
MSLALHTVFSLSIGIAAILAAVRLRAIPRAFLPFVLLLWARFGAELAAAFLPATSDARTVLQNVVSLAEGLLLLWQFRRWDAFAGNRWIYPLLMALFCFVWTGETVAQPLRAVSPYYTLLCSITMAVASLHLLTCLLFERTGQLLPDPVFLVCLAFLLSFLFAVVMELFLVYGLQGSAGFRAGVRDLLSFVNLISNLLFAIAVLWIPRKPRYILQW